MSKKLLPFLLAISLAFGFVGGVYFEKYKSPVPLLTNLVNPDGNKQPDAVDFSLFWQVWNLLHERYVDKDQLSTQDLIYGAIDGMVKKTGDPYTVFFPPQQSENFNQEIAGSFGGVGIEVGMKNDILTVITPIKDSPADKAGILAGDKIVKIDDKSTAGMDINTAVNLIRGKIGTTVRLTYVRKSTPNGKEVSLVRDTIKVPAVKWEMVDGHIAHLEIFEFSKNVDVEFEKAAREIVASKADSIILDVRGNPGGLLDSAVNIAGYFLDANQLVTTEKYSNGTHDEYRTQANALLKKYPLVILINKGSASASEILSGALKDDRGITLIGEKSFGKGSVQEVLDLPMKTSFKITIAKWYTPKDVSINHNGIDPTIPVERTEQDFLANKDPQLDRAVQALKAMH